MADVWRTRYGELQTEIVFATGVTDPSTEVTDSSLAIWVGASVPSYRISEIYSALENCMAALVEANNPVPASSYQSARTAINGSKVNIIVADDTGAGFTDFNIGVLYGPNYPENATGSGRSQLFISQYEWLRNAYLERAKLVA